MICNQGERIVRRCILRVAMVAKDAIAVSPSHHMTVVGMGCDFKMEKYLVENRRFGQSKLGDSPSRNLHHHCPLNRQCCFFRPRNNKRRSASIRRASRRYRQNQLPRSQKWVENQCAARDLPRNAKARPKAKLGNLRKAHKFSSALLQHQRMV